MIKCHDCRRHLPESEFLVDKNGYTVFKCRECRREYHKKWRETSKTRCKTSSVCPICGKNRRWEQYRDEKFGTHPADQPCKICLRWMERKVNSRYSDVGRTVEGKICGMCKKFKPWGEFWVSKGQKDGHQYDCKECHAVRVKKTRAKKIEHYRAKCREYYANNREELLNNHRERYAKKLKDA